MKAILLVILQVVFPFIAVLGYGFANMLIAQKLKGINPFAVTATISLVTCGISVLLWLVFFRSETPRHVLSILLDLKVWGYTFLISAVVVVGFLYCFSDIMYMSSYTIAKASFVTVATVFGTFPIVAYIIEYMGTGETPSIYLKCAAFCVMCAVGFVITDVVKTRSKATVNTEKVMG